MLPLPNGYADERSRPIIGQAPWSVMRLPWLVDLFPNCVDREGKPGWESTHGSFGTVLVLPSSSEMARRWGPPYGISSGLNHTGLELIQVS